MMHRGTGAEGQRGALQEYEVANVERTPGASPGLGKTVVTLMLPRYRATALPLYRSTAYRLFRPE